MLFNSLDFAIFLPIVFATYWFIATSLKKRNIVLLVASYIFYGWWDWRFLSLIAISTLVDYLVGIGLGDKRNETKRGLLLLVSLIINLGFLGFFKYYNFFLENFIDAFTFLGFSFKGNTLKIILPVGISFYTFQTLSYSIDVYKGKIYPTKDLLSFAAFVSFFPQLVAGPIERATNLLPQFWQKHEFNYREAVDGCRQMLWGFVKKIVIADNCAVFANEIFNNSQIYSGSTLVLGAVFFTFQIYCDFSGYSDIAIGTSKLFGFRLMRNFSYPYFSRSISEFWRRWHISLSTWFRDYLYIPLGGSKGSTLSKIRNTLIIFIVSGFWHGANWTFIVWGLLNAIYFLPEMLVGSNRKHLNIVSAGRKIPSITEFLQMLTTFTLVVFAWIFFRADSLIHAFHIIGTIFSESLFMIPAFSGRKNSLVVLLLISIFTVIEWVGRENEYAIEKIFRKSRALRWSFSYVMIIAVFTSIIFSVPQDFIYFQF